MGNLVNLAPIATISLFGVLGQAQGIGGQSTSSLPEHLGLRSPGHVPEVFAPGIISGAGYGLHGSVVFSPDMRMILWAVLPPAVMSVSVGDGEWSDPEPMGLEGRGVLAPAFSPDGTRLYYQDIWWVRKEEDGWGTPVSAGPAVNTDRLESQPSLAADGTLYFTGTLEGAGLNRGIFRSGLVDGEYGPPELLGSGINSQYIDYCPWIAADESFLLFASSRPEAEEHMFLHVSFRQEDGSWSRPENIHSALGFQEEARFPSVSPDGRFLFFVAGDSAYYFRAAEPPSLAAALEQVLADRDETRRRGDAAAERAGSRFSWDAVTLRYVDLFRSLADT